MDSIFHLFIQELLVFLIYHVPETVLGAGDWIPPMSKILDP